MSCDLCPRLCHVDRSIQRGFCGCDDTMRIARIGLHRYEGPCICGEGGSGAVFFSGCNLRCVFCQNKVLQSGKLGQSFTPKALASAMLELQRIGAQNINLVTPTPHVYGILTAIDMAKEEGLHLPIVYNTNGYLSVDTVDKLKNYVDIWLPDFKYHDQRLADRFSSAPRYFETALAAIGRMLEISGQLELDDVGRAKKRCPDPTPCAARLRIRYPRHPVRHQDPFRNGHLSFPDASVHAPAGWKGAPESAADQAGIRKRRERMPRHRVHSRIHPGRTVRYLCLYAGLLE